MTQSIVEFFLEHQALTVSLVLGYGQPCQMPWQSQYKLCQHSAPSRDD